MSTLVHLTSYYHPGCCEVKPEVQQLKDYVNKFQSTFIGCVICDSFADFNLEVQLVTLNEIGIPHMKMNDEKLEELGDALCFTEVINFKQMGTDSVTGCGNFLEGLVVGIRSVLLDKMVVPGPISQFQSRGFPGIHFRVEALLAKCIAKTRCNSAEADVERIKETEGIDSEKLSTGKTTEQFMIEFGACHYADDMHLHMFIPAKYVLVSAFLALRNVTGHHVALEKTEAQTTVHPLDVLQEPKFYLEGLDNGVGNGDNHYNYVNANNLHVAPPAMHNEKSLVPPPGYG